MSRRALALVLALPFASSGRALSGWSVLHPADTTSTSSSRSTATPAVPADSLERVHVQHGSAITGHGTPGARSSARCSSRPPHAPTNEWRTPRCRAVGARQTSGRR
jgi:hypothetical protein